MNKLFRLSLVASVLGPTAFGIMGGTTTSLAATPTDTLVVAANLAGMVTIDPGQAAERDAIFMLYAACDSLAKRNPDDPTKADPGLATWDISADGQSVTFHIRPGLKFPKTGNPITADDAVWSISRMETLGTGAATYLHQWGFNQDNYQQFIRKVDDQTIEVTLPQPAPINAVIYSLFTSQTGMILDKDEMLKHEVNGDLAAAWGKTNFACAGPYSLETYQPNNVVTFVRNEDYYDEKPAMKRLVFQHVPESGAQRLLLEQGDADVAISLNSSDMAALDNSTTAHVVRVLSPEWTYLALNRGGKPFENVYADQAMRYLVDYDTLEKTVMKGIGVTRQVPTPIGVPGALPEDFKPFKLDLDKAKELFAKAGVKEGDSFYIRGSTNQPWFADIATHIQENAKKIGINIKVEILGDSDVIGRYRNRDFDGTMAIWAVYYADLDASMTAYAFNPDNSAAAKQTGFLAWRTSWLDPWFVQQILAARGEQDPAKRAAMYDEMQRKFVEESPYVTMFQDYRSLAIANNLDLHRDLFADYWRTAVKK